MKIKKIIYLAVITALLAAMTACVMRITPLPSTQPDKTIAEPSATPDESSEPAEPSESIEPSSSSTDFYGESSDTGYTNDVLGFSITYPKGFMVLDKEQVDQVMAQAIDDIKARFTDPEKAQQAIDSSIPVSMAFKHSGNFSGFNANTNILIQKVDSIYTSDIVLLGKMSIQETEKSMPSIKYGEVKGIDLNAKSAAVVDAVQTQNDYEVAQKQYFFACGDYFVIITLSATKGSEMDEMAKAVEAIDFAG